MSGLSNRLSNRPARLLPALLLCLACGSGNSLEGSLGDEVPLAFDAVSVEVATNAVAILYTKSLAAGSSPDLVLKVTANTTGLTLNGASTIDLTQLVAGQPRGAVTRAVSGDGRRNFPPLVRGSITLNATPSVGANLSGSFTVTFGVGGELGNGKVAFGDFSATVKAAGQ